jgi:hypothetical protein
MELQVIEEKSGHWRWRHPVVRYQLMFLIIAWVGVHGFLFYRFGNRLFVDAVRYVAKGTFIFEEGSLETATDIFYLLPIFFIGLFKWLAPDSDLPFLIFQSVVSAVAMLLLYIFIYKKYNDRWAGFFTCVLILFWWDNIHWNIAYMTESLFCSLGCFLICALLSFDGSKKSWTILASILMLTMITRPAGAFLVFGAVGYLLHYHWSLLGRRRFARAGVTLVLLVLCFMGGNLMLQDWDFMSEHKLGNIVTYANTLEGTYPRVADDVRRQVTDYRR